ncbi:hypothetical protein [Actinokineospora sp.]|uniref:hypothetical protein n=1 Tax=Actinokineospora sp. TaxID=1872133 RepID=UPI00403800F4
MTQSWLVVGFLGLVAGTGVGAVLAAWARGYRRRQAFYRNLDTEIAHWAECSHTAPNTRVMCADDGPRCLACQLIVGDRLADRRGDPTWRS